MAHTDSPTIRSRYAFTLGANLLRSLLNFTTGMLLARGLGPESYGSMAFLLGTFVGIRQLLDMGSSTAFFTFVSRFTRSRGFVGYYMVWLAIQFILPLLVIGLLFPDHWLDLVWKGEHRGLVVMAFMASFMQDILWQAAIKMCESQRLTRWVQAIGLSIALTHLTIVAVLWLFAQLGLYLVLGAIALECLAASWLASTRLHFEATSPPGETANSVIREFARYCLPLVAFSWVGFLYEFADRWLLQNYGGSVEQAYYAVGAQIAGISLIATSSVLNIFWKEIAEAHHGGDSGRVAALYRKVSRILYMVGATMAGFLLPWTEDIIRLLLGPGYVGAALAMAIMFLYPVHQSMGQVGGIMLYATGRVRAKALTGIGIMLAGIVVSYFVLAPPGAGIPGLGLASTGLAIKMVAMQFLSVNIIAFLIARGLGVAFDWLYQLVGLSIAVLAGWGAHALSTALAGENWPWLATMVLAGLIYAIFMACALLAMPWLVDARRSTLTNLLFGR